MNTTPRFRIRSSAVALAVMSVLYTASASAAPKVLENAKAAGAASVPARGLAQSGVVGRLGAAALSAPSLELQLPDGQTVTARLQRIARDDKKAVQSWIGTFDDAPGSSLVLSKAKGVVTGYANYKDQVLELLPAAAGQHVLFAVDTKRLPQTDEVTVSVTGEDALSTTDDYGTGGTTTSTSTSGVVHDVLVLYTGTSAATWGQATLESMIHSAVQSANQAYQNSRVSLTLNVVGLQKSPVSESSSGMSATLNNLKQNSTVRSLRDKLAADMVILVSEDSGSCGQANLTITTINGVTNVDAYAISASKCLSSHTLAHELGHLQRLDHNRENKTGGGAYAYSFGYRQCVTGGFRDVMSYPCSGVPRVLQFSNPNVYYNGYPTGISYESDPSNSAEAARTLSNTATAVAAYRVGGSTSTTPTVTAPLAPSNLSAPSVAYNAVSLAWSDNSTDESGFKLERSTDGVNYSEIASLGAGTVRYTDGSVGADRSYYYRVRAFNSAGGSAFSNVVGVDTPSAPSTTVATPPLAPSNLSAPSVAYDSVSLAWADNSIDESGFKLERSADGVSFTEIASLGAGTVRYTDGSVGADRSYYYRVRAFNSAGGSAFSNVVGVDTPSAPAVVAAPATPASVAASNEANGSALVSWSDASSNETAFEVRRETWNAKRSMWSSLTTVGTVPADVTSMLDLCGNGTYRYSVRAVNSSGGSGFAGPAQVSVSGGSTRGKSGK